MSQARDPEQEQEMATTFSHRITAFSLHRRVTVLVLFCSILVVGIIAMLGLPLELFPRGFQATSLRVSVPWRDATSRETLDKITLPLEEELSTVKGLDSVTSWSGSSRASVTLRFKQGIDMNVAYREVRDRVERARARFPADADRVFISKEDMSGIPVAAIGVAVDADISDSYNLIQKQIVFPLKRIEGIADVQTDGLIEKEIIIEVDRAALESQGMSIYELSRDLGADNFTLSSGNVRESGKKFLLRSVSRYENLEQLRSRVIRGSLKLGDVAEIRYEAPDQHFSIRVDGKPAFALLLMKEGEANTIEVTKKIKAEFDRLQANPRLASVEMTMLFAQGDIIQESLDGLVTSGKQGIWLAMLVLFFFLRRFRITAIITFSIPLSLVMSLIVMYFAGETLNLLTLLGLIISIGMLVDNSIVVAENIQRLFKAGVSRKRACIEGAAEIALAITMATLTTVAVFLPVSLVEGQAQFFMLRLSLPICVSLLASLLVAIIFIPLCAYLTLSEHDSEYKSAWLGQIHGRINKSVHFVYDLTIEKFNRFYVRILALFLRRRLDLVIVMLIVFAITLAVPAKKVKFTPQDEESQTQFQINVDAPVTNTFEDTKAYFLKCEKVLERLKKEHGYKYYFIFHRTSSGQISGSFDNMSAAKKSIKEITKIVYDALPKPPGYQFYYGQEEDSDQSKKADVFQLTLYGEDYDQLELLSKDLSESLLRVKGVAGIQKSDETQPNQIALQIDRERSRQLGMSPNIIASVVGFALRGSSLARYRDGDREVPVLVRFAEQDRESLDQLNNFLVPAGEDDFLPISSVTDVKRLKSPGRIYRTDKRIAKTMVFELDPNSADDTRERLQEQVARLDLPEGVSFGVLSGGDSSDDLRNMQFASVLSVVFIFLLMGFLFESYILPWSILCTLPLAFIGVVWMHFLWNQNLDVLGFIGVILLIGVVVNNGIVLVDYVIRLRSEGEERGQALLFAAERRFRPIAMTAMTTIFGMVPLLFTQNSEFGLSYKSFGLTLIGGMTSATLLTLLVVPVFYTFFDDLRNAFFATLKRGSRWKPRRKVAVANPTEA